MSAIEVVGYQICAADRCSTLILEHVALKTGGFCVPCAAAGLLEGGQGVVVRIDGGRFALSKARKPQTARNRRQHERRKGDPTRIARRKDLDKAKRAAMRRLRAFCPELYDLLLADERQKRGLDPIPVEMALRPGLGVDGWETMTATAFYHALARQESPVDGSSHPNP